MIDPENYNGPNTHKVIALINQWAVENSQKEIQRLQSIISSERKLLCLHIQSHNEDLRELLRLNPEYPFKRTE